MMERNSRFLSLSGLSGMVAGAAAFVGAAVANNWIQNQRSLVVADRFAPNTLVNDLFFLALAVLATAVFGAYYFTNRKARLLNEKLWTDLSKKILVQFSIPLLSGGVFALAAVYHNAYVLVAPGLLIFYGLACIAASARTYKETFGLGLAILVLGLVALFNLGNGLLFWTLGFGFCHFAYGVVIFLKYDRTK